MRTAFAAGSAELVVFSLPGKRLPDLWTPKRDPNNSLLETTTAWNAKTVYWDSRYLRESQHWAHRETTVATVPFVDSAAKLSLFAVNMCKGNGCLLNAILGGMVCIRWYQMQALQPQTHSRDMQKPNRVASFSLERVLTQCGHHPLLPTHSSSATPEIAKK